MHTLKTKIKLVLSALLLATTLLMPASTLAANDPCHPENDKPPGQALTADQLKSCESCQGGSASLQNCLKNNTITSRLNEVVNFLSAGVGIVVAGVIILGGIQYTLAGANTTALAAARQRIINGLIALAAFMFIYAFLQWIIPGGIFK